MTKRAWQVLIIVGGILALVGGAGVVSSFSVRYTGTIPIPAGALWYFPLEFDVVGGGSLSIDYAVMEGTVNVYVLTEAQYAGYQYGGFSEGLFAIGDTAAGSFDVALPTSGKYFVTFEHGWGFEGMAQEVRTTVRLLGIDPAWLSVGLAFVAMGGTILAFGFVGKRRAMRVRMPTVWSGPAMAPPSDVFFFPLPARPEPPAPPSPPARPERLGDTE
jgi:hypothetical protein